MGGQRSGRSPGGGATPPSSTVSIAGPSCVGLPGRVLSFPPMTPPNRIERDPLGEKAVPASALYGIQTLRAAENFPISGLRPLPAFVDAVIWIKRAAALTHKQTGRLDGPLADAIVRAADEVLAGQHRDQFIVDVYQAGAGTSHNMNCNEVLANRANEILGGARGTYTPVHPNDHVNMAQSTNDVIPTAMRLAALAMLPGDLVGARSVGRGLSREGHGVRHDHEIGTDAPAGRHAHPAGPGVHGVRTHRPAAPEQAGRGRRVAPGAGDRGNGGRHRHQRRAGIPRSDDQVSA